MGGGGERSLCLKGGQSTRQKHFVLCLLWMPGCLCMLPDSIQMNGLGVCLEMINLCHAHTNTRTHKYCDTHTVLSDVLPPQHLPGCYMFLRLRDCSRAWAGASVTQRPGPGQRMSCPPLNSHAWMQVLWNLCLHLIRVCSVSTQLPLGERG